MHLQLIILPASTPVRGSWCVVIHVVSKHANEGPLLRAVNDIASKHTNEGQLLRAVIHVVSKHANEGRLLRAPDWLPHCRCVSAFSRAPTHCFEFGGGGCP